MSNRAIFRDYAHIGTDALIEQAREAAVDNAVADEHKRFNEAVKTKRVIIANNGQLHIVEGVTKDWWYIVKGVSRFCGANDEKWAERLKQAGVERHPLFK